MRSLRTLPELSLRWKWLITAVGAIGFFYFYGKAAAAPEPKLLPMSDLELAIPLLPWTIVFYLSDYLYILLLVALLRNQTAFSRASYGVFLGVVISLSIFVIYPTTYPRSSVTLDPPWSWLFAFLHGFDAPSNCFPSLHVSNTLIPTWYCAGQLPQTSRLRKCLWIWAIAICISTVTTKQHYAVDVLGGILVSLVSIGLVSVVGPKVQNRQNETLEQDLSESRRAS